MGPGGLEALCFLLRELGFFYSKTHQERFLREEACKLLEIFFHLVSLGGRISQLAVVHMQGCVIEEVFFRKGLP